jgi:hypothetical protein
VGGQARGKPRRFRKKHRTERADGQRSAHGGALSGGGRPGQGMTAVTTMASERSPEERSPEERSESGGGSRSPRRSKSAASSITRGSGGGLWVGIYPDFCRQTNVHVGINSDPPVPGAGRRAIVPADFQERSDSLRSPRPLAGEGRGGCGSARVWHFGQWRLRQE